MEKNDARYFKEQISMFNDSSEIANKLDELSVSVPAHANYYMKEAAQHIRGQHKLLKEIIKAYESKS